MYYHKGSVLLAVKKVNPQRQPPIIPWYPVNLQKYRQSTRLPECWALTDIELLNTNTVSSRQEEHAKIIFGAISCEYLK